MERKSSRHSNRVAGGPPAREAGQRKEGGLATVSRMPWDLHKDWDALGPSRALYEDMATRAAAAALGHEPGRDARAFARVIGDGAEIHLVCADAATLDTLREAISKQNVQIHEHLVERPDRKDAERVQGAWAQGKLLPPPQERGEDAGGDDEDDQDHAEDIEAKEDQADRDEPDDEAERPSLARGLRRRMIGGPR